MKKTGLWLAAAGVCLACLLSVPSFAAEKENYGPAFVDGQPIAELQDENHFVGSTFGDASGAAAKTEKTVKEETKQEETLELVELPTLRAGETPIGELVTEETKNYTRGESLGEFQIVGYYGGGSTFSGAPTQNHHTIAADLSVLPIGTKVLINNTVYTVEDKGSKVKGKMIDVYFDTKEEAVGVTWYGKRYCTVYKAVVKS